ncbi:hypothetical protein MRX96_055276 [Rhipicephalus microplus]
MWKDMRKPTDRAGSWQEWLYEVRMQDQSTQVYIYAMNISDTTTTVRNLRPDTAYSVKVRAYSAGGRGPWSVDFVGRTLRKPSKKGFPYMLWSANEALLKSGHRGRQRAASDPLEQPQRSLHYRYRLVSEPALSEHQHLDGIHLQRVVSFLPGANCPT